MKGRRPDSKTQLERRGAYRSDRHAGRLELPPGVPSPPRWLTREACAEWRRIVPTLASRNIVSEVDRAGIALLCTSWSDMRKHALAADRATPGSAEWRRYLVSRNESFQVWLKLAERFGLTPVDRRRLRVSAFEESAPNDKARFFRPRLTDGGVA